MTRTTESATTEPAPARLTVSPAWERHRARMDRGFRVLGFAATFFGLAMLVVFLVGLIADCVRWFDVMPGRVAAYNDFLRQRASPESIARYEEETLTQVRAEAERRVAAALPEQQAEIRAYYENTILPRKKAEVKKTAEEWQRAAETQVRPNTSRWATFVHFLTAGPSYRPEDAGILPALMGSILLGAITLIFAVPLGVGAALYLEEYAARSRLAKVIQINISNLAGVPSVVFGLLGAFVFVELIFKPMARHGIEARNVLGGGLTLALLTLPVIIVSAQEAIRAVPISIRHGAYALGASRWQTTWTLVLPGAMPGILTGTILALARALGEAAPLVLFGALLHVSQTPTLFSRFTVMPMQIFGWADDPDRVWEFNAALASVLLLLTLLALNAVAIYLRQRTVKRARW